MSDRALRLLFKDKRLFVALYSPTVDAATIDFDTGYRAASYSISLTQGAVLSSRELKDFARRSSADNLTAISSKSIGLVLLNPKVAISLKTKIVIAGETYAVKTVDSSPYGTWNVLAIEHLAGQSIFTPAVLGFNCVDRTRVVLDKLNRAILDFYGGVLPVGLEVWPVAGLTVADSLTRLYGNPVAASGSLSLQEVGRKAGYEGSGTIDGVLAPKRVTDLIQTSDPSLTALIASFNTDMGRL